MKSKILHCSMLVLCLLFATASFLQNVIIDYSSWEYNPNDPNAVPPCNIFGTEIDVPAKIGGVTSTIKHQTQIGQPIWTKANKYIEMAATFVSSSSSLGTKYRIAYNFKVGAKYMITVNAAEKTSTQGFTTGPNLKLRLTNTGGGGSTVCTGPGTITSDLSGNPPTSQLSLTTYADYQFVWGTDLGTSYSTLEVFSIPATNGGTNAIRIKKSPLLKLLQYPQRPLLQSHLHHLPYNVEALLQYHSPLIV